MQRLYAKILIEYSNSVNVNRRSMPVRRQFRAVSVLSRKSRSLKLVKLLTEKLLSDTVAQIAGFMEQIQKENCSNCEVKTSPSHVQKIYTKNNINEICMHK